MAYHVNVRFLDAKGNHVWTEDYDLETHCVPMRIVKEMMDAMNAYLEQVYDKPGIAHSIEYQCLEWDETGTWKRPI